MHHGLIQDPYVDDNEAKNLWIGEVDWTYETNHFPAIKLDSENELVDLAFEGLDTVVDVYFNNTLILSAKDMFLTLRISGLLKSYGSKESLLELRFKSAVLTSRKERARIGYKWIDNKIQYGGSERFFLRQTQYHWGWNWGLVVNTGGHYKDIYVDATSVESQIFRSRLKFLKG
jgi:beta-mannosidase